MHPVDSAAIARHVPHTTMDDQMQILLADTDTDNVTRKGVHKFRPDLWTAGKDDKAGKGAHECNPEQPLKPKSFSLFLSIKVGHDKNTENIY